MPEVDAKFPKAMKFLFQPARYKVAHGGRGSAKSWSFARALITKAAKHKLRILCARELQMSIQDSVHKLLEEQIEAMGLSSAFVVQKATILGRNGSEFIFAGIRSNPEKIKSTEGVDICWVEEAEKVSERSWEVLIPTIRKAGSEIWVTFNPDQETDPTSKRFHADSKVKNEEAVIKELNWHDNPYFPDELRKEKDYLYRVDPDAAAHVWGGKFRHASDAQIFRGKYVVEAFDPYEVNAAGHRVVKTGWIGPQFGADWGFSTDPTVLVKTWICERKLYIEYEAYKIGCELNNIPALFNTVPGADEHVILADNSRPETIFHVSQLGLTVVAADKWPGSVEDGIEYLRAFEQIVIHPRCRHAEEEARLYKFKVDAITGLVLPVIVDKHNHCVTGDTLVETTDGPRAIESLVGQSGNLYGQEGATRFNDVRITSPNEAIYKVTLEDGRTIKATAEHMLITSDGWCPVVALEGKSVLDAMDTIRYDLTSCRQNSNTLAGSSSPETRKPDTTSTAQSASEFIQSFGRASTDQCRRVTTSTTKTRTDHTTRSTISNAFLLPTTKCITGANTANQGLRHQRETWQRPLSQQSHGTSPQRELAGTSRMASMPSLSGLQSNEPFHANNAAKHSRVQLSARESFALTLASLLGAERRAAITFSNNVLSVESASLSQSTQTLKHAAVHAGAKWLSVKSVKLIGHAAVFNLETDSHTFLINGGIVSHNCWDSIRYALSPAIHPAEEDHVIGYHEPQYISSDLDDFDSHVSQW